MRSIIICTQIRAFTRRLASPMPLSMRGLMFLLLLISIDITATDASGVTIGKASIAAAPFKRNRSTDYSGPLFGASGETSVTINNEWGEPFVGEW